MGPRASDVSTLVSIDFAAFADRSDEERRAMREALYSLVERSFTEEGIDWSTCLHEDRGDGILIVVPQHVPRGIVLTNVLMTSLPALLARYNDAAMGFAELWLRIAVHVGDVHRDAQGLLGSAVHEVFRLIEIPALKVSVALGNDLSLVVSDAFFQDGFVERDPDLFRSVEVRHGDVAGRAWLYWPHDHGDDSEVADRIRVLIVDERAAVRARVARTVAAGDFTELVGMESSIQQAIKAAADYRPDVILLGINALLTAGIMAIRRLSALSHVVLLARPLGARAAQVAVLGGASGAMPEDSFAADALITAMRQRDRRHEAVDDVLGKAEALGLTVESASETTTEIPVRSVFVDALSGEGRYVRLTGRESQALRLALQGRNDREIAADLSVAQRTARRYVGQALTKLGIEGPTATSPLRQAEEETRPTTGVMQRPSGTNDFEDDLSSYMGGPDEGRLDPSDLMALVPPSRFLAASCPARATVESKHFLFIRILMGSPKSGDWVKLRPFDVPEEGARVQILLQLDDGLLPLDRLEYEIEVPARGGSDPVAVPFLIARPGLQRVQVMAWVGGTFVGELTLEISAETAPVSAAYLQRAAPLPDLRAVPGEVTLQVRRSAEGQYMFQLMSDRAIYDPIIESIAGDPADAIERTLATLRDQAAGGGGGIGPLRLREAGVNLWNQMVPQAVKDQFWELHSHIKSFSIATDYDIVPWELLYPVQPGGDEGFLVEQFPVARRVYNQQFATDVAIHPPAFVIPDASLVEAAKEVHAINRRLFAASGDPGKLFQDVTDLVGWITSGQAGLLHFACHNNFNRDGGGSSIAMRDDAFEPVLLSSAVGQRILASRAPLVFMNACRSAGAVFEYTGLNGWACQFMRAGAGAFIGTLWEVPSGRARLFAEAFYDACLDRHQPLGEAARTARQAIKDTADPTWLAYTVYGDPTATVG